VLENRVLRKIFGPKRDEIKDEWRILHQAGLYDLYASQAIRVIKKNKKGGECGMNGGQERGIQGIDGET
jgi:hypothetical protein